MIGAITWIRAGLVFIAEMLAGMAAAGIVSALFPGPLNVATTLNSQTSVTRGLCKSPRQRIDAREANEA